MKLLWIVLTSLCLTNLVTACGKSYLSDFCYRYKPITDVDSEQVGKMNQIYACECLNLTREERKDWCQVK